MTSAAASRPSLVRIITVRLAVTSLLAIILQLTVVVVRTYLIENDLNRSIVTRQAQALLAGLHSTQADSSLIKPACRAITLGKYADFYAFRISDAHGHVLAAAQRSKDRGAITVARRSIANIRTSGFWIWTRSRKLYVAGGVRQRLVDHQVWIEVATFGDPASTYLGIVATEVVDDVWIPMIPLVVLTLGVATLSVRRSLSSLVRAAAQAEFDYTTGGVQSLRCFADAARSGKSR